jgi:Fur family ferric uptake transcriptional regulator
VEEYFGEPLLQIRHQVQESMGFQILLTRTEIGGYCANCQMQRAQELDEAEVEA